ncbi:nucleotide exchange factor GrpE [Patescibacteria group bacterium]|nr:nucleotide exchange factor GrpE [Patescibacteria group bacterium]
MATGKKDKKEIDILKQEFKESEKQKDEYLAGWQRSRADFLNYKKEEAERIGEILKYATTDFIFEILPILASFEKAEKEIRSMKTSVSSVEPYEETKIEDLMKGFLQIKTQLQNFLKNHGLEEIKSLGEKFDPNFHEIIEEVETKNKESGIIIEEIQKGYKIKNRLLRPAKVKISKQTKLK